jgi:hypothetical protein
VAAVQLDVPCILALTSEPVGAFMTAVGAEVQLWFEALAFHKMPPLCLSDIPPAQADCCALREVQLGAPSLALPAKQLSKGKRRLASRTHYSGEKKGPREVHINNFITKALTSS